MNKLLKATFRVIGWTLTQAVIIALLYEGGKEVTYAFHRWRPDIGRGILWLSYIGRFICLAFIANAALEIKRIGSRPLMRFLVWVAAFFPLVLYTLPSWPILPLAVPFIHACAITTIIARETMNRFAPTPPITAAGSPPSRG